MLAKVRQLSVEFYLPNKAKTATSKTPNLTIQDYRCLVGMIKSIENQMIRFSARGTPWCKRRIRGLKKLFRECMF